MNNKRNLKQAINGICNELLAECMAASLYGSHSEAENVETLLASIIAVRDDFVSRISHPEPGMKPQDYYKQLINDFEVQINELADHVNNLI